MKKLTEDLGHNPTPEEIKAEIQKLKEKSAKLKVDNIENKKRMEELIAESKKIN